MLRHCHVCLDQLAYVSLSYRRKGSQRDDCGCNKFLPLLALAQTNRPGRSISPPASISAHLVQHFCSSCFWHCFLRGLSVIPKLSPLPLISQQMDVGDAEWKFRKYAWFTDSFLPSYYFVFSHQRESSGSMAVNQEECVYVGMYVHMHVWGGGTWSKRKKIPGMSLRGDSSKTGCPLTSKFLHAHLWEIFGRMMLILQSLQGQRQRPGDTEREGGGRGFWHPHVHLGKR